MSRIGSKIRDLSSSSATPTGLIPNAANESTNENSSATTRLGFFLTSVVPSFVLIVTVSLDSLSLSESDDLLSLPLPHAVTSTNAVSYTHLTLPTSDLV